jgi:hypothetical protein
VAAFLPKRGLRKKEHAELGGAQLLDSGTSSTSHPPHRDLREAPPLREQLKRLLARLDAP